MAKNDEIFGLLNAAPEALAPSLFADVAKVRKVSVETLTAEFEAWKAGNADKLKRKAAKAEREKRADAVKAILAEIEAFRLTPDTLGDFPALIERVKALKGKVSVNADLSLSTDLKVRKSKGGPGRRAKDAPSPYVDEEGERIYGDLKPWATDNFSEEELEEMGCYRPVNGSLRTGAGLAKRLIEAGVIVEEAVDA